MRKIVAIGGNPGCGKTTLVKIFISNLTDLCDHSQGKLIRTSYSKSNKLHILGVYDNKGVFQGTDRLSMAVQPQAQEWIKNNNFNILFEGDRLFNLSFIRFLSSLPDTSLHLIFLEVDLKTRQQRLLRRGTNQSAQFLKSRETKYETILSQIIFHKYGTIINFEAEESLVNTTKLLENNLLYLLPK